MAEENRRLKGTLELNGIDLTLKLGLHPFERLSARSVPVDLVRNGPLMENGIPLVDYSEVCTVLVSGLREEYLYVEELAGDILELLNRSWPGGWRVRVRKIQPPVTPSMAEASVTVES
jgi:dihydroneopterin aldolase